jgi:Rho termination factor, N-terminal domain
MQLAQDKKFRKRLLSAIEHGSEAGHRTRHRLGVAGAVTRLAGDQPLLSELRGARNDLQYAYRRIEERRHRRKLGTFTLLALLAALPAAPQLRKRLERLRKKVRNTKPATETDNVGSDERGRSRPSTLENLTKEELYARAQAADIPGRSEMSKEELIEALRKTS